MKYVFKPCTLPLVNAYELGKLSSKECDLIRAGRIYENDLGKYLLFSPKVKPGQGAEAQEGDFFKLDFKGYPYPIARKTFLQTHRHVDGDLYEELHNRELQVWSLGEESVPVIDFLIKSGQLEFHPETPEKFFRGRMHGAEYQAPEDYMIIFYDINTAPVPYHFGDVDFNFISKEELEKLYAYSR